MPRPDDLFTDRLTLRPPSISDTDDMYGLVHHPDILRWTGIPFDPYRREHAEQFIKSVHAMHRRGSASHWSIRRRSDDTILGMVTLYRDRRMPQAAEIGCWLGKPHWGQGIMSEAFRPVIDYGFKQLGFERIFAFIFDSNRRSEGLVRSLGFEFEGRLRRTRKVRGRWRNESLWAIIKPEWRKGRKSVASKSS